MLCQQPASRLALLFYVCSKLYNFGMRFNLYDVLFCTSLDGYKQMMDVMTKHAKTVSEVAVCVLSSAQDRDDYKRYNRIVGMITKSVNVMKQLDPQDGARIEMTDQLLEKWVIHNLVRHTQPADVWFLLSAMVVLCQVYLCDRLPGAYFCDVPMLAYLLTSVKIQSLCAGCTRWASSP